MGIIDTRTAMGVKRKISEMRRKPKLSKLQAKIVEALRSHPEGLDIHQIGEIVSPGRFQQELNRRVRELYPYYDIEKVKSGPKTLYLFRGEKETVDLEPMKISQTQRARILHRDKGRCQMCGKTISEDGVRLHIDHKIPMNWGGNSGDDNLWALCVECNLGKKNYFATFEEEEMREVLNHRSVHRRIAELLHSRQGEWVDQELMEFVANFQAVQKDWPKRTRELRYLGLEINTRRVRRGKRTISQYRLRNWIELPEDPTKAARDFERLRARENKEKQEKRNGG